MRIVTEHRRRAVPRRAPDVASTPDPGSNGSRLARSSKPPNTSTRHTMKRIPVIIATGDPLAAAALTRLISADRGVEVIARATNATRAGAAARSCRDAVAVIDADLAEGGPGAVRVLRERAPHVPIIRTPLRPSSTLATSRRRRPERAALATWSAGSGRQSKAGA
ncbi:MAG: hypothetical protein NVSMB25_08880 [Thermoleophilaceae bacterium]